MIDINLIRQNPDLVKENIRKKFQDQKLPYVDEVLELDKQNRALKKEGDELRASRNKLSSEIGLLMKNKKIDEVNAIKQQVVKNNERIIEIEKEEFFLFFSKPPEASGGNGGSPDQIVYSRGGGSKEIEPADSCGQPGKRKMPGQPQKEQGAPQQECQKHGGQDPSYQNPVGELRFPADRQSQNKPCPGKSKESQQKRHADTGKTHGSDGDLKGDPLHGPGMLQCKDDAGQQGSSKSQKAAIPPELLFLPAGGISVEQRLYICFQYFRQFCKGVQVRIRLSGLIVGDRLSRHEQLLRQLLLGQPFLYALSFDILTDL